MHDIQLDTFIFLQYAVKVSKIYPCFTSWPVMMLDDQPCSLVQEQNER